MESGLKRDLFAETVFFGVLRSLLVLGLVLPALLFTLVSGALLIEGFGAPDWLAISPRGTVLAYGLMTLVGVSAGTRFWAWRLWQTAWRDLTARHARRVARLFRDQDGALAFSK